MENKENHGIQGEPGKDYVLTEQDEIQIANKTSKIIQPQIEELHEEVAQLERDIVNTDNKVTSLNEELQEQEQTLNHLGDVKADRTELKDFITKTVNDLVNYYKKTETYTQTEVNQLIGTIKTVSMKLVPERPQVGETNIIYLIPRKSTELENIYDEYIFVNNKWEKIGSTEIDLSNVYTKEEINTILHDYITANDLEEALLDYVTIAMKYDFIKDGLINNTNQLTDEEKLKIETWLGLSENYLTYYNITPYNVEGEYNPAHKKYVDEAIQNAIGNAIGGEY